MEPMFQGSCSQVSETIPVFSHEGSTATRTMPRTALWRPLVSLCGCVSMCSFTYIQTGMSLGSGRWYREASGTKTCLQCQESFEAEIRRGHYHPRAKSEKQLVTPHPPRSYVWLALSEVWLSLTVWRPDYVGSATHSSGFEPLPP